MDSSRLAEALSTAVQPSARIYLLPCGLGALSGMAPMVATGTAMPLAGGPLEGALVRVAATGALDRSRELALDYARRARACLNGELQREELETLTHLVVQRES